MYTPFLANTTKYPFGIEIDSTIETLTNLRFADDILLFAQSKSDIGKMLKDLKDLPLLVLFKNVP